MSDINKNQQHANDNIAEQLSKTLNGSKVNRSSSVSSDDEEKLQELMRKYLPAEDTKSSSESTPKEEKVASTPMSEEPVQETSRKGGLFARMREAAKRSDETEEVQTETPDMGIFEEAVRDMETDTASKVDEETTDSLMKVLSGTKETASPRETQQTDEAEQQRHLKFSKTLEEAIHQEVARTESRKDIPVVPVTPTPTPTPTPPQEESPFVEVQEDTAEIPVVQTPVAPAEEKQQEAEETVPPKQQTGKNFPLDTAIMNTAAEEVSAEVPKKRGFSSFFKRKNRTDEDIPLEASTAETADEQPAGQSMDDIFAFDSLTPDDVTAEDRKETEELAVSGDTQSTSPADTAAEEEELQKQTEQLETLRIALGMSEGDADSEKGTAARLIRRMEEEEEKREANRRANARLHYEEYESYDQTGQITNAYKRALGIFYGRSIIAVILTIALFLFENLPIFGMKFNGALNGAEFPVVYSMVSLQIFLIICACAYKEILSGLENLFFLQPSPESIASLTAIASVLYSAGTAFFTPYGVSPKMYNFCGAFCILAVLGYTYFTVRREMYSFDIVSTPKSKHVFRSLALGDENGEREDGSNILRIENADFISGFFNRTESSLKSTRIFLHFILWIIVIVTVVLAVVSVIFGNGISNAVKAGYMAIVGAAPISVFFAFSFPFYKVNKAAHEEGATIIGESSLEEYAGATDITFDDVNAFSPSKVKVINMKFYGKNRIDRIFYYAASVFSVAGGPLASAFTSVIDSDVRLSSDVKIIDAAEGYLAATVDGRHLLFGRSDMLRHLHIHIPEDAVAEDSFAAGDVSIMYIVRDMKLISKLYIRYTLDSNFETVIRQFTTNGTRICINTLDPNIDEKMISVKLHDSDVPLRVIKTIDEAEETEYVNSGIVTRGTQTSLLNVVGCCDMILNYRKLAMVVSIVAVLVAALILFVGVISGTVGQIQPLMIIGYHFVWGIILALSCKARVRV